MNARTSRCGICAGSFENMGRVEKNRLIHEHLAAICDDRCTSARGPLCSCKCGGKLIEYYIERGLPQ